MLTNQCVDHMKINKRKIGSSNEETMSQMSHKCDSDSVTVICRKFASIWIHFACVTQMSHPCHISDISADTANFSANFGYFFMIFGGLDGEL